MKRITVALILLFACLCCFTSAGQKRESGSLKVDGRERTWKMFLPTTLKPGAPLVVVLHGYGGSGEPRPTFEFAAEKHGFAVCYPDGLPDPKGGKSWNVGYPFQEGMEVNDIKALCKIARAVQKKYNLSRDNAFLTGNSNGGEMCYLMALSKQDVFRAVAPISGLMLVWMYRELEAPKPIPVFELHGSEDTTSLMEGDMTNEGGWGEYMPVHQAVNYFVAKNRCLQEKRDTIPGKTPENGRYVVRYKYTDGIDGIETWLYVIVHGKHSWGVDDIDTGEVVWEFFSKYLK